MHGRSSITVHDGLRIFEVRLAGRLMPAPANAHAPYFGKSSKERIRPLAEWLPARSVLSSHLHGPVLPVQSSTAETEAGYAFFASECIVEVDIKNKDSR